MTYARIEELELEVSRLRQRLAEYEPVLRRTIDAVGMGTWTCDWVADVVMWDAAVCEMFGVSAEQAPKCYAQVLRLLHPDDLARVDAAFTRSRASGVWEDLECRLVRPSGEVRHIVMKGSISLDAKGGASGWFGAVFDVTARKRVEEQLYQGQKMEAIGQLTAGVAHNFNNVLSIILPNVALCLQSAPPHLSGRLADIQHAAQRAADLVRQLMLFARRDMAIEKAPLDLRATLRRTVQICRTTFGRKISFELSIAADVPRVRANAGQLEQVLLNICINARDAFEDAATPNPWIEIRIEPSQFGVCISVCDNGPGMDEQTRARVFEPFFTTKQVGRGTGLGLASAYAIIDDHGGRITCESWLGHGALFRIELPALASDALEARASSSAPRRVNGSARIFVVDDEPLVRRATRAILEHGGYRVLEAAEGHEALQIFERERGSIDVAILDRAMPGLPGEQLFTRLRQLAPSLPIVLLSGQPSLSAAEQAAAVLSKPVDLESLLGAVRSAVAARGPREVA